MSKLTLDISRFIPNVINALCETYGEEYRNIINERINKVDYFFYKNIEGMKGYYSSLLYYKRKELSNKFIDYCSIFFSNTSQEIINACLGSEPPFSNKERNDFVGIKSFYIEDDNSKHEQIKFLNFCLGNKKELLTTDNITIFEKTNEYKEIEEVIKKSLIFYNSLLNQYDEYIYSLNSFSTYIIKEELRYKNICDVKREKLIKNIKEAFQQELNVNLDNDLFFHEYKINDKFLFEYFSKEDEEKLISNKTSEQNKKIIYQNRLLYFKLLGLEVDAKDINSYDSEMNVNKEIVPSFDFINKIINMKEDALLEADNFFISTEETFKENFLNLNLEEEYKQLFINKIKDCKLCTLYIDNKVILVFSIYKEMYGKMDFFVLHELIHCIETNDNCTGFDIFNTQSEYKPEKRKYEILNETITDMITMEILKKLHLKGINLIEPKIINDDNIASLNTSYAQKKIIQPFFETFRKQILISRLLGKDFAAEIGFDNYEKLNSIISRVDVINSSDISPDDIKKAYETELLNSEILFNSIIEDEKKKM